MRHPLQGKLSANRPLGLVLDEHATTILGPLIHISQHGLRSPKVRFESIRRTQTCLTDSHEHD
jgi:hypothetical protein